MADNDKLNTLSSSLSKLSSSLRGISTNKGFHFYNNFDAFKQPVSQIAVTSQSILEAIAASSSQLFGKQLDLPADGGDAAAAYDWLEKFSHLDFVDKNISVVEPVKPLAMDFTAYTLVEEVDDLKELAAKLRCADEFAVDLEHNQYRSYQGLTCLMQISTRSEDFVVDTLKLRVQIGPHLRELFKDPTKKKVMHGADRDIMWLQRDFGIYVCNMFDTGQASRVLKLERNSLEYLLRHYCEVAANKEYQNADWRLRPLTDDMLRYAREDTHYLLYIYDMMKIKLLSLSTESESSDASLVEVYQRSYDICMQLYEKDILTDSSYLHIYGIQSADLNAQQLAVAAGLCEWRDVVARAEDESTGYILPNKTLLEIARQMPLTTSMLRRAVKSRHHYIDRNLGSVVTIIRNSMKNAAAYEAIAEKLKEDREKISEAHLVVADGSEGLADPDIPDTLESATEIDTTNLELLDSVQNEKILERAVGTNEVERNEHTVSSDHGSVDLSLQNDKDGSIPVHSKDNFTMAHPTRETSTNFLQPGSETEATVQVLKKPSRAFGALLGNSTSKRKYDSGKMGNKDAKLEQIKSSVNLPFHPFSGKVETLQPVVKELANIPEQSVCQEPITLSDANSQMQDIVMIDDDDSDKEMFNDDSKYTDDKLETGGSTQADVLANSKSDEELLNDVDPKLKLELTEGNDAPSNNIIMLDDDSDEETVKDLNSSDNLQQDKPSTPLSSNEEDETMSLSDLSSGFMQTANEMKNTKKVKKSQEQESSGLVQVKPFDYEAARKEVRFGEDRKKNVGDEGGKSRRDTGNTKKRAAKGQSEGGEESGGFQLGRRRQAFPVTGNRSATFR